MDKRIVIGKIVAVHGIKGEVKVFSFTDDPEKFNRLGKVCLKKASEERLVHIISSRFHKNSVILNLKEISNRNEAEALKDWEVLMEYEDLEKLPKGRFYIFELVGLRVFTMDKEELGTLTDVLQTGANDVYVVKNSQGKEVLIPALKSVVKSVDLEAKEMLVDPLPGLLD